jgi:small redox-active disulfide protein 2
MLIQILGSGCPKCNKLQEHAQQAASELGLDFTLEKVSDISAILGFGVMTTPALVVDGIVKSQGKLLSTAELKQLLV